MPVDAKAISEIPGHIPALLAHDIDVFGAPEAGEDTQTRWSEIRDAAQSDIVWSPRNGGHWIALRAREIEFVQKDDGRTFSHEITSLPREAAFPLYPLTLDPPRHGQFRRLIMASFTPRAVADLEEKARKHAVEAIDAFAGRGECEFVAEFASVLPIAVFLGMVDLPWSDRAMLLGWTETMVRSPDPGEKYGALAGMTNYLNVWLAERAAAPGSDLLSTIVTGEVEERSLDESEQMAVALLMLFGGLDTVASMLGFIARFLAMNPGHRQQLVDDPTLIPQAIEELVRRHGIASTTRLIKQPVELGVAMLMPNDLIYIPTAMVGLDDRANENPLEVDFRRTKPHHAAFGNGRHACPGAALARREIRVFLEEWLKRIPSFHIKPGTTPEILSGMVSGVTRLELAW